MSNQTASRTVVATLVVGAAAAAYVAYTKSLPVKEAVDALVARAEEKLTVGKSATTKFTEAASAKVSDVLTHIKKEISFRKKQWKGGKDGIARTSSVKCSVSSGGELSGDVLDAVKRSVDSLLADFIAAGDITEACKTMREILERVEKQCGTTTEAGVRSHAHIVAVELVKRALYLCLDRSQQEQEIMACLLTSLEVYGSFSSDEIASGLDVLIARFDDVLLDAPEAAMVLAVILAHLILDGTLPESYLVKHASSVFPGAKVDLPLELPEVGLTGVPQMLSFSSWMLYGKIPLPLQQMKSMIRSFVQSCLLTGEPVALEAMLMDLHAPHYHYEVIKKLVQVSLDGTAYDREVASNLVVYLAQDGRVRADQVVEAFLRLLRGLPDLAIDVPQAPDAIARFAAFAIQAGVLPADFAKDVEGLVSVKTGTSTALATAMNHLHHVLAEDGDPAWMASDRPLGIWGVPKLSFAHAEFDKLAQLFVAAPVADAEDTTEAAIEAAITSAENNGLGPYLPALVSRVAVLAACSDSHAGQRAAQLLRTLCDAGTLPASHLLLGLFRVMEIIEFAPPGKFEYRESHFSIVDDPEHVVKIGTWLHLMLVACVEVGLIDPDIFSMLPLHLASRLETDEDTDEGEGDDHPEHSGRSMLIALQRYFAESMGQLLEGREVGDNHADGGKEEAEDAQGNDDEDAAEAD